MPCPKFKISTFIKFLPRYCQIMKVWSPLDKRISLRKFWSQKGFQYLHGPKIKIGPKKNKYHLGITLKIPETLEFNLGNVIRTRYAAPNFGPKKFSSTKKVLRHAQNPNFQLSLGFYLDTDQIMKVWSLLDKRISLQKILVPKRFPVPKKYYAQIFNFPWVST